MKITKEQIVYDTVTHEMINSIMMWGVDKSDRTFKVMTNFEGMCKFDIELKKTVTRGYLTYLENNNKIDKKEAKTLRDMINASEEDYNLAEIIINNK